MGFIAQDVTPISSVGPTSTTPFGREVKVKLASILRTDTADTLKIVLPARASIIKITTVIGTASDAGTTATITIKVNGSTVVNAQNAKTTGTVSTGVVSIVDLPSTTDIKVTGVYAESGTASTTGGPFYFYVEYVE